MRFIVRTEQAELHLGTSNNAYRERKRGCSNYLPLDEMLS